MLNVSERSIGDSREITCCGELDYGSADLIRGSLDFPDNAESVVIDLRQTTFVDSTGLSILVPRVQQLLNRETRVTLRLNRGVYEVLALVGMFEETQVNLSLELSD